MNRNVIVSENNEGKLQSDNMLWECVNEHIELNIGHRDTELTTEREDMR